MNPTPTLSLPLKGRMKWKSSLSQKERERHLLSFSREGNHYSPPPSRGRLGKGWGFTGIVA